MKVETKYGIDDIIYIPVKVVNYRVCGSATNPRVEYGCEVTRAAYIEDGSGYLEISEENLKEYI